MAKRPVRLAAGVFLAHNAIERERGERVSYAELGRIVAKAEGRAAPYSAGNVLRWSTGAKTPGLDTLIAMAELSGLPLEAVIYGEMPEPEASTPAIAPSPLAPLPLHGRRPLRERPAADKHPPTEKARPAEAYKARPASRRGRGRKRAG